MPHYVQDPICNAAVDREKAVHVSDYEGRRYYFCSAECKEAFERKLIAQMAEYLKQ
jgi:YHS domain-containing protein